MSKRNNDHNSEYNKAVKDIWDKGQKSGYEYICFIDLATGKLVEPVHTDGDAHYVSPTFVEIDHLMSAPPDSIHMIHNHPTSSSFSAEDLRYSTVPSVRSTEILGHDKIKYTMMFKDGQRPLASEIKSTYDYEFGKGFPGYVGKVLRGEMTEHEARKAHSHEINQAMADKYGWEYRRN